MTFIAPLALFLQSNIFQELQHSGPLALVVLGILVCFSVYSWTLIFAKWQSLRGARRLNARFLRAFRKADGLEPVMVASEQFRPSPLVTVFDFGYEEVARADYPLSRLTFVNFNRPPGQPLNPAFAEFVRFILSREGQQVVLDEAIFLPLRATQAAPSRAALD